MFESKKTRERLVFVTLKLNFAIWAYRWIICSCRYYLDHPKFPLLQLLEHNILPQQKQEYAPGSIYRRILFNCSYSSSILCSKWSILLHSGDVVHCFHFDVFLCKLKTSVSNLNLTSLPDVTFAYLISVRIPDFLWFRISNSLLFVF